MTIPNTSTSRETHENATESGKNNSWILLSDWIHTKIQSPTAPPSSEQIGSLLFCIILLTNKQTGENTSSVAE